jgi:hypothetical protein
MCVTEQFLCSTRSAISYYKTTTYGAQVSRDAAGICQNGIDCELAALDCVPHVDVWGFTAVDRGPPIDVRELPILKLHARKGRCRASGCRLRTSHRELKVSRRHCEAHKRQVRTHNFERKSLQVAMSDSSSCPASSQSIASTQQTIAAFAPPAAWRLLGSCLSRAPPAELLPKVAGVSRRP